MFSAIFLYGVYRYPLSSIRGQDSQKRRDPGVHRTIGIITTCKAAYIPCNEAVVIIMNAAQHANYCRYLHEIRR